jgi:glycosyltransferase involved in cell wall biosynthesis
MFVFGVYTLSCLTLVFFKRILGYTLIFYSVDFNRKRFGSTVLQSIYEWANKMSSKGSDQVWVVSEALREYQDQVYRVPAIHISNSPIFDDGFFRESVGRRTGNKLGWSGSFMTERQFDIFFTVLKGLQTLRSALDIYLVPISDHEKFETYTRKYGLERCTILKMYSRSEWQKFIASCDVGVAIYDDQFDQTKFCEPLKMWDYLMCGVPFVISREPSIPPVIRNSGVAYVLDPKNQLPSDDSLREFLRPENIKKLQGTCLTLAEQFSIKKSLAVRPVTGSLKSKLYVTREVVRLTMPGRLSVIFTVGAVIS